jgi:hypothetical protein
MNFPRSYSRDKDTQRLEGYAAWLRFAWRHLSWSGAEQCAFWGVEHVPYLLGWMPCPGVELFVDGGQTPANLLLTGVKIPVQTIGH